MDINILGTVGVLQRDSKTCFRAVRPSRAPAAVLVQLAIRQQEPPLHPWPLAHNTQHLRTAPVAAQELLQHGHCVGFDVMKRLKQLFQIVWRVWNREVKIAVIVAHKEIM